MSNYISDLLCHFVGRSKDNDDERFELLVDIIHEQRLRANVEAPDHPQIASDIDYKGERLGELFRRCDCACFCDIPDEMLEIHTTKYSKFGIGFPRNFLSQLGARPVIYVPANGNIIEHPPTKSPKNTPREYFVYLSRLCNAFSGLLLALNSVVPVKQLFWYAYNVNSDFKALAGKWDKMTIQKINNEESHDMLFSEMIALNMFLAYVKIFDENLEKDDPNNYYMEREWRSISSISFSLQDIAKVYLPSQDYKERFVREFPDYVGQFWIFNEDE